MIVRLTKEQKQFLVREAREKSPMEACGLLFGDIKSEEATVRRIVATRNVSESSTHFEVDPEEFVEALLKAEKEKMELIGFFHSHPATPQPSIVDIRYMKLWPGNIWVVISSIDYQISAYQTINNSLIDVKLEVN